MAAREDTTMTNTNTTNTTNDTPATATASRPSSVRCYAFDDVVARVTHSDKSVTLVAVPGRMWSEYASGPNLATLADTVTRILRERDIFVGLHSCVRSPRSEEDSAMRAMWASVQALYDSWYSERAAATNADGGR